MKSLLKKTCGISVGQTLELKATNQKLLPTYINEAVFRHNHRQGDLLEAFWATVPDLFPP